MKRSPDPAMVFIFWLASLLPGACGTDRTAAPDSAVRDSVGIQIVEHSAAVLRAEESWTIGDSPIVEIGAIESAPEYELFQVRSGVLLADGRIAIVNGGDQSIRFFDPEGEYLGAQGNRGEGPGEYRRLESIWRLPGDSILAWDGSLKRTTLIGPDGVFLANGGFQGELGNHRIAGVFGDRSVVVVEGRFNPEDATGNWQQLRSTYATFSADGERDDSIGSFPWYRMRFTVASAAENEDTRRFIRLDHETREFADLFPAYSRLLVDDKERLWVEGYRRPGDGGDGRWMIFGEDGLLQAVFSISPKLRILDLGSDRVLAVGVDEMGVEYVRLYDLGDWHTGDGQ